MNERIWLFIFGLDILSHRNVEMFNDAGHMLQNFLLS